MELGFPLKLIYLTKFAKILMSYVVFKKKNTGEKVKSNDSRCFEFCSLRKLGENLYVFWFGTISLESSWVHLLIDAFGNSFLWLLR